MRKVFISHAVADKDLAAAFEELLENGIGLKHTEIFCTSLEGQGIPPGRDFKSFIKEELHGAEVVIALITANYYASVFCNCELGATWIESKEFIPILVEPIDFNDLRGTLTGTQCLRMKDPSSLHEVYDKLKHLVPEPVPVTKWTVKKANFEAKLSTILATLKPPALVRREEVDAVIRQREEFKSLATSQDAEITKLEEQIKEISALKDQVQVAEVKAQHNSEWERFEELRLAAAKAVKELPHIAREGIYYEIRGENLNPNDWEQSSIRSALEEELIRPARFADGYEINEERPKVQAALHKVRRLQSFLEKTSEGFTDEFIQKYGDTASLVRRSMWEILINR